MPSTRGDYGFGLGCVARRQASLARMILDGFRMSGALRRRRLAGLSKEELAVVWMAQTPGTIRWKYRQMINALVYQAIVD
jgi:hypothetical protein